MLLRWRGTVMGTEGPALGWVRPEKSEKKTPGRGFWKIKRKDGFKRPVCKFRSSSVCLG